MAVILLSRGERGEARTYLLKALSMLPADSPKRNELVELLDKTQG
jgi:hypothetical protein